MPAPSEADRKDDLNYQFTAIHQFVGYSWSSSLDIQCCSVKVVLFRAPSHPLRQGRVYRDTQFVIQCPLLYNQLPPKFNLIRESVPITLVLFYYCVYVCYVTQRRYLAIKYTILCFFVSELEWILKVRLCLERANKNGINPGRYWIIYLIRLVLMPWTSLDWTPVYCGR